MSTRYTKANLEEIVFKQLENLNAMHDLIGIMKFQNNLLQNLNKTLKDEIGEFKEHQAMHPIRRKSEL